MKVLELFAGLGGFATALPDADIVAAVDINTDATATYRLNHPHPYHIREIESLEPSWLAQWSADLWWMSPPCTPFTQRGVQRDLDDPRCRALLHLIDAVRIVRPQTVCVENVVGFESSRCFSLLRERWHEVGYSIGWHRLCPSQLGWPNRRPRVYCMATHRDSSPSAPQPSNDFQHRSQTTLASLLDPTIVRDTRPDLWLDPEVETRYAKALDVVRSDDTTALTACFGASYGQAITRSGSYLRTEDDGLRRFASQEVARLLGFPENFRFPPTMSEHRRWHLLGNSLSIPIVQRFMRSVLPCC